ncbi:MAG: PIN domain-containing protein [Rhizomicrobium sp.]|jgi:predicted nucleic acid-binding protein
MSDERFTLDSNILVYSVDRRDARKQELALAILRAAAGKDCPLALQSIGEFYAAATRKLKLPPSDVRERARQLINSFETFSYTRTAMRVGLEEAALMRFSLWDGVLVASAAEAGCTTIFSEDMGDKARLGTIMVCRPFDDTGLTSFAREMLDLK